MADGPVGPPADQLNRLRPRLDAVRLGPTDDAAAVTAAQVRDVIERIIAAGHRSDGDGDLLIVADADYDLARLAFLLADLPVEVCGRLRADRVPARDPVPHNAAPRPGRPRMHGTPFALARPTTRGLAHTETRTETTRYGTATASASGPAPPGSPTARHRMTPTATTDTAAPCSDDFTSPTGSVTQLSSVLSPTHLGTVRLVDRLTAEGLVDDGPPPPELPGGRTCPDAGRLPHPLGPAAPR